MRRVSNKEEANMKKTLSSLLAVLLLAILSGTWGVAQASPAADVRSASARQSKIDAVLETKLSALQSGDMLTVIVTLRQQADLSRVGGKDRPARLQAVIRALKARAAATQGPLARLLTSRRAQGQVRNFTPLWVVNGFSVTATSSVIDELALHADVLQISPDDVAIVPAQGAPEPNIGLVNAPALWSLGDTGQGVVVANMDSGVDVTHPDLAGRWRGGANSWFDPYGQHPTTPTDLTGHGTWTMSVMVGGDAGGTSIGVAPGAQWIAVKMFNDQGASTATAIHQGFQWLLDPDGDPATADAPQVVNNSWAYANPGCYLDFEPDLESLRSAGILPVFAAGNGGPYSNSSYSPANNPAAFAVGAINNNSLIYGYSSRGPSTCGGSTGPFPDIVAPGVNIRSADLLGGYASNSGTSLAAPHAAGALALLLSAYPNTSAANQEAALINTAVDRGTAGPDNTYGYGRLDVEAAFNWLASSPAPTVTPTATDVPPTATAVSPTATAVPPTATAVPPTATAVLPTATTVPPTVTAVPPTATTVPPTATAVPPTATTVPPTATAVLPTATAVPPTATPLPPTPTPTATPGQVDLIFADGFESGSTAAWSSVSGPGAVLVNSSAAFAPGLYGMAARVSGGASGYGVDDSPTAETSYHARFYFHPNNVTIGSATEVVFNGLNARGQVVFQVQFHRTNAGAYQVRGLVSSGRKASTTSWVTITNAYHPIEIAWQSASSASFSLYVDGALKQTLTGLNTSAYLVDTAWLGPSSGLSGISGTQYFDNFSSTRLTYIGP
jgi:subtilisin family serine protease